MKDFTTFREDLASGRPAKKPVSSSLLKNRAKENEKAMKSGFMKMPDYARKKFDEEKEEKYKPHMMYKGDKKVMAKKKGDHERLQKQGYDHDNPETKKIEEVSDKTLKSYISKSNKQISSAEKERLAGKGHAVKTDKDYDRLVSKPFKRRKGVVQAKSKIQEISAELINKVRTKRKIQHGKEFMDNHGNVSKETQKKMDRNDKLTFSAGARKIREEKKNCGCGQDPCITYGKGGKMEKEQVKEGAMKRMATDKEESKRLSASKGTFPGNDMATFKKKPVVHSTKKDKLVSLRTVKEENIFEISDVLKKRYIAKANKDITDTEKMKDQFNQAHDASHKKRSGKFGAPSYGRSAEGAQRSGNIGLNNRANKRRKGVAQARSKLGEVYEKGRGPTGIAFAIPKGHPDAENPKTRKKYPERQTPEYKASWKSKSKKVFGEEKQKGVDGKVCWKGYKRMGTKKKGGKTVDNCVKVEDFVLDAFYDYYLAELSPQTIKSYQKKAGAQYRDLKKTTPSRQSIVTGYHKGYISDKEYDQQHAARDKLNKRGKGLAMSKGKGVAKEEKMIGSEYSGYMKGVKSTNRDVRSAVSHTLDQKKSPLTKKHAKHPEVKKAQKYMTQEQMQLMTNLDMDESISALVKRGVGKVKQAMGDAGQAYRDNDDKQKKAGKGKYYNPMSGDNIAKRYPGRLELKKG